MRISSNTGKCISLSLTPIPATEISREFEIGISIIITIAKPISRLIHLDSITETITHRHITSKTGKCISLSLTLVLLIANLANTNDEKNTKNDRKMTETLHMGTHLRVLSEGYPMNASMTGFR